MTWSNNGRSQSTILTSFMLASCLAVFKIGAYSSGKVSRKPSQHDPARISESQKLTPSQRHCKPGGYLECQELDVWAETDDKSLPADSSISKWCINQEEAAQKMGRSLRISGQDFKKQMEAAGFVNVEFREYKLPIGPWPKDPKLKEVGLFQLAGMLEGIDGLTLALWTRFLGWDEQEITVFLAKVKAEFKRASIHSFWPL